MVVVSQTVGTYLGCNSVTSVTAPSWQTESTHPTATTTGNLNFQIRFSSSTAATGTGTNYVYEPIYQLGSEQPVFHVQIPIHGSGFGVIGSDQSWSPYIDGPKNKEEQLQARAKSMELLQDWLTAKEYRALTDQGELEIPSAMESDVVFLVKRDPQAKVVKVVKGKPKEMLCVLPEEPGYADGDVLLSKIMMLKTDPARFQKLANVYPIPIAR